MCDPKPITLLLISDLNPVTIATDKIITAKPRAMPIIAIVTIGCEIPFLIVLSKNIRRAIKSSVFNVFNLLSCTNLVKYF